jgi:hypothetical protein
MQTAIGRALQERFPPSKILPPAIVSLISRMNEEPDANRISAAREQGRPKCRRARRNTRRAAECVRLCQETNDLALKAMLLVMAQRWLELAKGGTAENAAR